MSIETSAGSSLSTSFGMLASIAFIAHEPGAWTLWPRRTEDARLIIQLAHFRAAPAARISLKPESERHGEVLRNTGIIAYQEGQRPGPASHVAIDRIVMLLQRSRERIVILARPQTPVLVEPK